MTIIKKFEAFSLYGDDEEMGKIILNVDGKKSTWYYVDDAILDGLLIEHLGLDDILIDELYEDDNNIYSMEDLRDTIVEDFEQTLDELFSKKYNGESVQKELFDIPSIIEISGDEEEGDFDVEYSYGV